MSESDFNAKGGTFFAIFKSSSGFEHKSSCDYKVIKKPAPYFTFSPSTLSLACDDLTPKNFSIYPFNTPMGSVYTFKWSYSGWSGTVTPSFSSIVLTPNSGTLLPSKVSVIPYVNGVAYPEKSCTITRSLIVSKGFIYGNMAICKSGTYTFNGLLAGQTVTWSLSNRTAGTLSSLTGPSTIFTITNGGTVDIIATVSNACGQSYAKRFSIFAGPPPSFSIVRASNESCDGIKYHYVPFEIPHNVPDTSFTIDVFPNPEVTVTQTYLTYNNILQDVLIFPQTYSGVVELRVSALNSCGKYTVLAKEEINKCSPFESNAQNINEEQFAIYPNPASDIISIELRDSDNQSEEGFVILGELFDMNGISKIKIQIIDNKATFSVKGLKKGLYILRINKKDQTESHQIAVE